MNGLLLERETGSIGPQAIARYHSTQLLHNIVHASNFRFDGGERGPVTESGSGSNEPHVATERDLAGKTWAHQAGINAIAVDRFDGRLLLSGGADSSIKVWDLEDLSASPSLQTLIPKGTISKSTSAHKYGITQLNFYPFDAAAFLSSSYDHTLKLYATETLALSASFDLDSNVYDHAVSPIASHLLVACATQHPAIRLVDLRSGSSAHSLAGHSGALLSVAWSPSSEHILASGGTDGTARVWDVRKSAGTLGLLDMEDSVGVLGHDGFGLGARARASSKAHSGAVNGLSWTDDGAYIITAGHDERVRVWSSATGANTLTSFGPTLKNGQLSNLPLLSSPTAITPPGKQLLFYPNEQEIIMFELQEGKILKRLKIPGPVTAALRNRTGERNVRNRVTALAWRGISEGIFSGHSDGQIRAWVPKINDDIEANEDEPAGRKRTADEEGIKRKRNALDDVFRDLTRQKITFG